MGQSAVSPSDDSIVKPASLTERLAEAEANGDIPYSGESTSFSMARRFAPRGQTIPNDGPVRPLLEPTVTGVIPEARNVPSANRGLAGWILIALVPAAILLGLLWESAIRLPESERAIVAGAEGQLAESHQTLVAVAPPVETVEPKTDIALSAPSIIEAKEGEDVAFDLAVDFGQRAPRPQHNRHSRDARGRHLLARAALRRHGMEPQAGRDR